MLDMGIWTARHNMINLSLPVGANKGAMFEHAVDQFIDRRRPQLDSFVV
jgi:hypothetical protein